MWEYGKLVSTANGFDFDSGDGKPIHEPSTFTLIEMMNYLGRYGWEFVSGDFDGKGHGSGFFKRLGRKPE
jgi:hypothetical protein